MDYGKHMFERSKREKEMRKSQKVITLKEVRITPNIDDHDLNTKLKNAIKFLKSGDKVKFTVRFRGREVKHSALGENLLVHISEPVSYTHLFPPYLSVRFVLLCLENRK